MVSPLFVTFSPDESHNLIMVRMSRTRRSDPVFADGRDAVGAEFCGRSQPALGRDLGDDVVLEMPVDELRSILPERDARQAVLAKDPLAAVDGFRVIVMLTHTLLFGVRMCPLCPDCNGGDGVPCQNLFGSSSTAEGGILGRADAVYTSVEAQKSTGSLHAHSQLFVECMHQHTPLVDVMQRIKGDGATLV